ncbi:hypothetical protein F4814DRAFT_457760 [Daldinia grandis]|nr:hypothetical protein F4814DRAFT_457760 [Daldinia grandis]
MPRILYYHIDCFEDGLQPVWGDSDEEGGFGDVDFDNMDEEVLNQHFRDRFEEFHQEHQQPLSQRPDNDAVPIQATPIDEYVFSDHMRRISHELFNPMADYYGENYYEAGVDCNEDEDEDDYYGGGDNDYEYHDEVYELNREIWEQWHEKNRLVVADTYSWWWFPIVVERVNNGLYSWNRGNYWDDDTAAWPPISYDEGYDFNPDHGQYGWRYDSRNNQGWENYEGEFSYDGPSQRNPAVLDEIDESLPNLANFPPDRDYFIHPRHPTDQWWPLS